MTLDLADRYAIHELLALYGHLIDDRRWDDLHLVFTDDVVFDASDFGQETTHSLAELTTHWRSDPAMHPLAHHATNIVIESSADDGGAVRVRSKGLGVGPRGRVGSAVYDDVVVRTGAGWRLAVRRATLRRAEEGAG